MSSYPINQPPEAYLEAGDFSCPHCKKPVTDIDDAVIVMVHAHVVCSKIGLTHGGSDEFRKAYNDLLNKYRVLPRLTEPGGHLYKLDVFKKNRLSKDEKEEFKAFKKMKKDGLIEQEEQS